MRTMLALLLCVAPAAAVHDSPITEVVTLLQGMLDKSKEDGKKDRELFAKFQCFCDTTTKEKETAIAEAQTAIETMEALLADLRAQNGKLSQEVAHLKQSMDDNEAARKEATELRDKEHEDFLASEQDMVTGIDQLGRAIDQLG